MVNWVAAYNRLYKFLDGYTGSQFIRIVQETDPDLDNYSDFIRKRQYVLQSTTKVEYFKDILLGYSDEVKHHLFEVFLEKYEKLDPEAAKEIRTILKGQKVTIRPAGVIRKEVDEALLTGVLADLKKYELSYEVYLRSLNGLKSGKNERHILDDLRLSLELFLKEFLQNDKSLENQIPLLGKFLKEKGISAEIGNTLIRILDLYSKYQNNYVKHNDEVNTTELELVFNLTNVFFRFLLNLS